MALIGDDCRWFYTSQCRNGDNCQFRHCEEALGSTAVCPSWLEGGCYLPHCPYRHAHIVEKASQPWDEFGSWNRVGKLTVHPVRSSLVAVPIVGGSEPLVVSSQPAYHVVKTDMPLYHPYNEMSYDNPQYGSSQADVVGQASVIITPRHDDLFPPQVKPVVVRLGSNEDSSDSDESEAGRSNLTTLRRVDTLDTAAVDSADPDESPRLVVEKEKTEAPDDDIPPERQAVKKEDVPVAEKVEESDGSSDYEEGSSEERDAEAEDENVEEEEDSVDEDKSGSEDSRSSSDEKSESSGATTASKEAELEPELDLFDEDDADFLGVVEKTPIAQKEKRRKAESRRTSKEDRLQERRERRESQRRSRSPLRPTRRQGNDSPARPARHLVRRGENERKKATEKPSVEKKESVEVLSLEEIMRQKALQSMVERRKQKEEAEKVKQGAAVGTDTPRTYTPDLARRDSPKRPNSRNERRWSPVQRDRPAYGRSRSPPLSSADSSRWRSRPNRGDYPPYSDYDTRWRRYDDDIRSDARQLSMLQAQSDLMDKIARVASGSGSAHMLSERDLKRQQKLLKRQLKHLSKRLETASGSDSRSSSVCTTCSDSSSAGERRRRKQKAKKSKRKKSKKSRRKSAERGEENENRVEGDYAEYEDNGEYNDDDDERTVSSPKGSELEIALPKVLPRAKVVVKLDDESKSLNMAGADLLLSRKDEAAAAKENKLEPVSLLPGRKIQLKKAMTTAVEAEESRAQIAIADRLAAKKADDEATKLMLAKIRENAMKETRKIVMGSVVPQLNPRVLSTRVAKPKKGRDVHPSLLLGQGSAGTGVSKLQRARRISEETDVPKVVASQPGRVVQLKPERTSPTTDDGNSKSPPSSTSFETDVNKRRIIRRQPVQVYVPPSVKRKADGDHITLPSNEVRSHLDKIREETKTKRALTPEPPATTAPVDSTNSTGRRATVADIRTSDSAGDVASTKFELGVKTFAEIMREKKERKARELKDKRKLANSGQQPTKLKINRPSVKDRLSLPKETAETKPLFKATPTAGSRTIEKYEVDWLEENSVDSSAQTEEGLLRVTPKRRNNLASNAEAAMLKKRARTEPARQLNAISVPLKSKSEALVTQKDERARTNFARDEDDFLLLDDDSPTDMAGGLSSIDKVRAVEKPSSSSKATKARTSSERKSMSNAEWDEINLLLDDEVSNVPDQNSAVLPTSPKNVVSVADADDDELLLQELDELLG